jgi:TonB family protein
MASRTFAVVAVFLAVGLSAPGFADQSPHAFGEGAVHPGNGIKSPTLIKQVVAKYTAEALRAKIEGEVEIEAVVSVDGTVGDARVVRSLDHVYGLDDQAVKAAKEWLFKPGTDSDGNPVPVIVTLIVSFRTGSNNSTLAGQVPAAPPDFASGTCRAPSPEATAPTLVHAVEPKYTQAALRAKIAGEVILEAVVDPDGTVTRARVVQSLDQVSGLDGEALDAAARWTFEPRSGKCQGQPAPVVVTLVLNFRVH